jgi:hypothetical protein
MVHQYPKQKPARLHYLYIESALRIWRFSVSYNGLTQLAEKTYATVEGAIYYIIRDLFVRYLFICVEEFS